MADEQQQSLSDQGPLSGAPPADLGACVAGLVNAVAKGMAEEVAPHGLIPLEFALLRVFLARDEWTATQLANVLPVDTSRISRVVTKLVGMGLIARRRRRDDRRVVMLELTEEGRTLTIELHRRVQAYDAKLMEGISEEEKAVFLSTAYRVISNHAALRQETPQ